MANFNDSGIVKSILTLPVGERLNAFYKTRYLIKDDSTYWQVLAGVWMSTEICSPYRYLWVELFTCGRRNRHKLMKKGDRYIWRGLPEIVAAYRAVNPGESVYQAISWTLNPAVAKQLARGREIRRYLFHKEDIIAYFDRRHEQEIIVIHEWER